MLETLFWLFQCSKNPRCHAKAWTSPKVSKMTFSFAVDTLTLIESCEKVEKFDTKISHFI